MVSRRQVGPEFTEIATAARTTLEQHNNGGLGVVRRFEFLVSEPNPPSRWSVGPEIADTMIVATSGETISGEAFPANNVRGSKQQQVSEQDSPLPRDELLQNSFADSHKAATRERAA